MFDVPYFQNFDASRLIDWHDWKAIEADLERSGPGEKGVKVTVEKSEEDKNTASFSGIGFSSFVSDVISIERCAFIYLSLNS